VAATLPGATVTALVADWSVLATTAMVINPAAIRKLTTARRLAFDDGVGMYEQVSTLSVIPVDAAPDDGADPGAREGAPHGHADRYG
jgi:hypothetical protein